MAFLGTMKAYAGIGARHTPDEILPMMTAIAKQLASNSYVLRSGHAPGADQAFEEGADKQADIFLPWPGYERLVPVLGHMYGFPHAQAYEEARRFHPRWDDLSSGVHSLLARNAHVILGRQLDDPAEFAICWTPDAKEVGGTGHAIRIARAHGVRVFNLFDARVREAMGV